MKDTNWSKWSSVAEIISSIAILITLVYLAVQTSQNNVMLESQSRVERSNFRVAYYEMVISNPELQRVLAKIRNGTDPYDLNAEEQVVLQSMYEWLFVMVEYLWKDYQAGLITYEDLGVAERQRRWNQYSFTRDIWEESKKLNDPEFVRWADENLFEIAR